MKCFRGSLTLFALLLLPFIHFSQTYILNGSAVQNSCNCYTLTPAVNTQSGSVWNANKISLVNPFDFVFNVFLGCTDANGADGIVFMLQPISTSVGTTGEGMGFEGISPSIGISLDTWQNTNRNDPVYDHISIQANGVVTHGTDLAGPIQASSTNPNIEDCQWHTFRIAWDPVTKIISTYFDGNFMLQATVDLVSSIFNNDPMVYWGFSAGTGGSNNLQQFCTALNPLFITNLANNSTCLGTPVVFTSTSQSFAPIAAYHWDFGDGNTSSLANPAPHTYANPGIYQVKLAIKGLDGCNSDTLKKDIIVGDYPVASFDIFDTCAGIIPRIIERSTVNTGNITQWIWMLDGSPVSIAQLPQLQNLPAGTHQLELNVISNHGCSSIVTGKNFRIDPKPQIDANGQDGCANETVSFVGEQLDNATTISSWNWNFGDNQQSGLEDPQHIYSSPGNYSLLVYAVANNGCHSDTIEFPVFINQALANAGNDTTVIKNEPFQLNGTGGETYSWSPSFGLNDAGIPNPVVILEDDARYTLTVTTVEGCTDTDEIVITVFKGSAIYVPSAFTPNNDGLNDRLKPYYVGIKSLEYFSIYNRWGQLVFTTRDMAAGWNADFKGAAQATGTFVWMIKAVDFVGKVYQIKGSSTIIR